MVEKIMGGDYSTRANNKIRLLNERHKRRTGHDVFSDIKTQQEDIEIRKPSVGLLSKAYIKLYNLASFCYSKKGKPITEWILKKDYAIKVRLKQNFSYLQNENKFSKKSNFLLNKINTNLEKIATLVVFS